jgi:hypothetical protein
VKKFPMLISWILPVMLAIIAAACSPKPAAVPTATPLPTPTLTPTAGTFTDPFAYCSAVGTVDKPDARYAGEPVSDEIINGFKQAAGLAASTEPIDTFKETTIWRCMDSKVYACNFGANLPCDSKAQTDKTPSQAIMDYCKANPNSQSIPMSVTGHDTIYSWGCIQDNPQLLGQIGQVDAQGYLAQIWYEIKPIP